MAVEPARGRFRRGRDARRVLAAAAGIAVVGIGGFGLRDPLASMASYTASLMALNQAAPPLLLLSLPRGSGPSEFWFDPWVATSLFVGLSTAVSLPGIFNPGLVDALFAAPLGLFEFIAGLLFWAQFTPATRSIQRSWLAGVLAWAGGMPMAVVAVVWMLSPTVLYTPYLDVICRWNVSPLMDQKWAGLVMLVAGVPLQIVGAWLVLGVGREPGRPDLPRGQSRASPPT